MHKYNSQQDTQYNTCLFEVKCHKSINDVVLLQPNDQIYHAEECIHCIHCIDRFRYLIYFKWVTNYSKHFTET